MLQEDIMRSRFSTTTTFYEPPTTVAHYYEQQSHQKRKKIHLFCILFIIISACLTFLGIFHFTSIDTMYNIGMSTIYGIHDMLNHMNPTHLTHDNSIIAPFCKKNDSLKYKYFNTFFNNNQSNTKNISKHMQQISNITAYINNLKSQRILNYNQISICNSSNITRYNIYQSFINTILNVDINIQPKYNPKPLKNEHKHGQHQEQRKKQNFVRHINRCRVNSLNRRNRQFGGLLSGDPLIENNLKSALVGFLHNYKAGGTSIRDTMHATGMPGISRLVWHRYGQSSSKPKNNHLREFFSHLFMFAYIRDPIDRLISSFFELHRRNVTLVAKSSLVGIHSFRYLLSLMKDRMDCSLANKYTKYDKMNNNYIGDIYFNMHIMPQMYFFTEHGNPWLNWPLNFVGNMSDIYHELYFILHHFHFRYLEKYKNERLELGDSLIHKNYLGFESFKFYEKSFHWGRDRHLEYYINGGERRAIVSGAYLKKYQVERSELNDDDIRDICHIYFMDYLCIPFDIPWQCNLTQMFLMHYGDDIEYRTCFQYESKEWNPVFKKRYQKQYRIPKKK